MTFSLPDLPYAYDSLAPYMSECSNSYYYKHHLAYVNNGANLLKGTEWEGKSLEDIVRGSYGKNVALFNNAGQHYNHTQFCKWMKPNGGGRSPVCSRRRWSIRSVRSTRPKRRWSRPARPSSARAGVGSRSSTAACRLLPRF